MAIGDIWQIYAKAGGRRGFFDGWVGWVTAEKLSEEGGNEVLPAIFWRIGNLAMVSQFAIP